MTREHAPNRLLNMAHHTSQALLSAKAKEAELNARMLSLESQIHWLTEQNTQLQQSLASGGGGPPPAPPPAALPEDIAARIASLESELRKSRRAEQKLQALLFRCAHCMRLGQQQRLCSLLHPIHGRHGGSLWWHVGVLGSACSARARTRRQQPPPRKPHAPTSWELRTANTHTYENWGAPSRKHPTHPDTGAHTHKTSPE